MHRPLNKESTNLKLLLENYEYIILNLFRKPHIFQISELCVRIFTDRLHLHGFAAPAKKKEAAWNAMDHNVERVPGMNLANETISSQTA